MSSEIALQINGREIRQWQSYRVVSSLFVADDAFELDLAAPDKEVESGQLCRLFVNNSLEMTGILDAAATKYDKQGVAQTLRGRDFMGLLADTYAPGAGTMKNLTLQALAALLLANVPFINRSAIIFGKGNANAAVEVTDTLSDFEFAQIEPAKTLFATLKDYALARGLLFWAMPDGTLVFGQPRTGGPAEFFITMRKDGQGNNAVSGEFANDLSGQYSSVTITGQQQGTDLMAAGDAGFTGTATNPDFPFAKPFFGTAEIDGQSPAATARFLVNKQRFDGFNLVYTVPGHSQGGRNWTTNAVCHVEDEVLNLRGDYLVHERAFELSKEKGATTRVKLAPLGVLPL